MAAPGYSRLREMWNDLPSGKWSAAPAEGKPLHADTLEELLGELKINSLMLSDVTFTYKPGAEEVFA